MSYIEKGIFLNPFNGKIKLYGQVASTSLPHLNMTSRSPVVRRRAVFEEKKMRFETDTAGIPPGGDGGSSNLQLPILSSSQPPATTNSTSTIGGVEKFRVGSILKTFKESNNQERSPLVVLTRREALKAYNEEILTKSENYDALMKKAALRLGLISYK